MKGEMGGRRTHAHPSLGVHTLEGDHENHSSKGFKV